MNTPQNFFFTDLTLYECLVKIGLANDSYPILTVEYAFGNWRYRLNYLPFNNVNALRHTINNATYIKKISETSNYAEIIESDAENVTSGLIRQFLPHSFVYCQLLRLLLKSRLCHKQTHQCLLYLLLGMVVL